LLTALIVFFLDLIDGELFKKAGVFRSRYEIIDKCLDYYWYVFILVFVYWGLLPAKGVFLFLFIFRFLGQTLFLITEKEEILFWFPNVFEPLFHFYLLAKFFSVGQQLFSYPKVVYLVLALTIGKLMVEYIIHIRKIQFHNLLFPRKASYWPKETREFVFKQEMF
jgi:hypothetical protein